MKAITTLFFRPLFILVLLLLLSSCFSDPAIKTIKHTENALSITLSHDANYVLIAHSQGYVELLSTKATENSSPIAQWQHKASPDAGVVAADFSKNSDFVVTAEQNTLALFSIQENKLLYFWSLNDIQDIKLSGDGEYALVSSRDKSGQYPLYRIVYFHLRTGGIKYAFYHDDIISSVALSENGQYALSGSDDAKARLWDLKTGELKYTWPHTGKIAKVALSADGRYAMTNTASEGIYLWDTKTGKRLYRLNKIRATVASAVFSADKRYLATGYSREEIVLWDTKTGQRQQTWRPARRYLWQSSLANVTTLAFKNKHTLVSETSRGIMQVWKISDKSK